MLEIESRGAKKLENYQNFAKAFRCDYKAVMASEKANNARLKTALELRTPKLDNEFGKSSLRAVLFALNELQREVDIDEVLIHLRDMVPGYWDRREDLMALATAIAVKRQKPKRLASSTPASATSGSDSTDAESLQFPHRPPEPYFPQGSSGGCQDLSTDRRLLPLLHLRTGA
jgi:hypothetical protein